MQNLLSLLCAVDRRSYSVSGKVVFHFNLTRYVLSKISLHAILCWCDDYCSFTTYTVANGL